MSCEDCDSARVKPWGGYRSACAQCEARAVARSLAAFNAIQKNEPDDLREMIARVFPGTPSAEAKRMVWDWWRIDHPNEVHS